MGTHRTRASALPAATFERLADEAAQPAVQHLAGLNERRRHAMLAAAAFALEAELTDGALSMFGKLMAQYGRTAERRSDERAARSMREVRADLRVLASTGRAILRARADGGDIAAAVAVGVG